MDFKAVDDNLPKMMAYIEQEASGIDEKTRHKVALVCEEILTNVIYYSGADQVHIECKEAGQQFEVYIIDHGKAFNPVEAPIDPQLGTPLTDRKIGGLGIHLMRQIASQAMYRREGEDNVLRLGFTQD